ARMRAVIHPVEAQADIVRGFRNACRHDERRSKHSRQYYVLLTHLISSPWHFMISNRQAGRTCWFVGLVGKSEFLMTETFRLARDSRSEAHDLGDDPLGDIVDRLHPIGDRAAI